MPSEKRDISDGTLVVSTAIEEDRWTVSLRGELDLANAATAEAALRDAIEAATAQVVVDLSKLEFIDSTGIALLIDALGRNGEGAQISFVPSEFSAVIRVLDLTGVGERLPLAE